MRVAFIVDPLDSLKAYKDSSIAMMRAAQAAGHEVWAILQPAISWSAAKGVFAQATRLETFADNNVWCKEIEQKSLPLKDFSAIVMRKDPPFDMEYVTINETFLEFHGPL